MTGPTAMGGILVVATKRAVRVCSKGVVLSLGLSSLGCRCGGAEEGRSAPEPPSELPLLDPIDQQEEAGQCALRGGLRPIIRASEGGTAVGSAFDLGGAVLVGESFAIAGQRVADTTHNILGWSGGGPDVQETDLGRAHGAVDPPLVMVDEGALFVLLSDNDAGGQTLQVVRVDEPFTAPRLTRAAPILVGRDDSLAVSWAADERALTLVWDQHDPSAERSRIWGIRLDRSTLAPMAPAKVLTQVDEDAEDPRMVERSNGYFLAYAHLAVPSSVSDEQALVVEPKRSLRALQLDSALQPGTPLVISDPERQLLAYDALGHREHLFVAHRSSRPGSTVEDEGIHLVALGPDGSMRRGYVTHDALGPGAPLWLGAPDEAPWLLARGAEAELLLAQVEDVADVRLSIQPQLSEHLPLARAASRLMTVRSVGLDWAVEISDCSLSKDKKERPGAAGK